MGLTLDELLMVKRALEKGLLPDESCAIDVIIREIRLKELERTIPKSDVNGNFTTGHGE